MISASAASAKFLTYSAIAFLVPARYWLSSCWLLANLGFYLRPWRRRRDINWTISILGGSITIDAARRIEREKSATSFATAVLTLGQRFARGRRQEVHVSGMEHIHSALEAGNGAILWVCTFSYARLVAKIGLAREGIDLVHLSHYSHGFGDSWIAAKHLNSQWIEGENLYLKERLIITADNEIGALRALRTRLKENRVVSITLGRDAKKLQAAPFLNGALEISAGPPGLALSTGAPILPVYTLRRDDGAFEVTVDSPLAIPEAGNREDQVQMMIADLATRLEPLVAKNPGQWANWTLFHPQEAD